MQRGVKVMLATAALDAVGIGLVMPMIPRLLREVEHTARLGWRYGLFLALYALMQFACAPVLGALSDRYGRRPVLLASLAGAAVDYLFMAFAPSFALLCLGRAIAGITSANLAVANSYIADVTPEEQRPHFFGILSACFGVGFIAGPVLGGLLGNVWIRAPFLAAAGMNAANFCCALFALPESRRGERKPMDAALLNPLAPLRWAASFEAILPLLGVYAVIALVGQIGGTVWVLYGEDRYDWNSLTIGLSIAGFGLFHSIAQAFLAGPLTRRLGERRALVFGITTDLFAMVLTGLASHGWMAFMLLPLYSLGGVGGPALQSMLSSHAGSEHQGRLQGVLASMTSLVAIVGPLLISEVYFASRSTHPGLIWIVGAAIYLLCIPLLRSPMERTPAAS